MVRDVVVAKDTVDIGLHRSRKGEKGCRAAIEEFQQVALHGIGHAGQVSLSGDPDLCGVGGAGLGVGGREGEGRQEAGGDAKTWTGRWHEQQLRRAACDPSGRLYATRLQIATPFQTMTPVADRSLRRTDIGPVLQGKRDDTFAKLWGDLIHRADREADGNDGEILRQLTGIRCGGQIAFLHGALEAPGKFGGAEAAKGDELGAKLSGVGAADKGTL